MALLKFGCMQFRASFLGRHRNWSLSQLYDCRCLYARLSHFSLEREDHCTGSTQWLQKYAKLIKQVDGVDHRLRKDHLCPMQARIVWVWYVPAGCQVVGRRLLWIWTSYAGRCLPWLHISRMPHVEVMGHVESYSLSGALSPRDVLYGGRCDTFAHHDQSTDLSLYPYSCKNKHYPVCCGVVYTLPKPLLVWGGGGRPFRLWSSSQRFCPSAQQRRHYRVCRWSW